MSTRRSCLANGYNLARRRFCARCQSKEVCAESHNATTASPSKAGPAAQQPVGGIASASMAGQWGGVGGPYMQQVMPGFHLGLTWHQMFWNLIIVVIATAGLAYLSITLWMSTSEVKISYTRCAELKYPNETSKQCELTFEVPVRMAGPVYVYYQLCNVYMNHRYMQTSWSMPQMLGRPPERKLTYACKKFAYRDKKLVMPCGALPNSIFNDTVKIIGLNNSDDNVGTPVPLASSNLSWPSHSAGLHRALAAELLENTVKPENWPEPAEKRYSQPFVNADDLWLWLTTPALSCFRKMIHRVELTDGLPAGKYQLHVGYNYPVSWFGGTKSFIVASKSQLGGHNLVLAILPSVVSGIYFLLSLSVLIECYCRLHRRAMNS